MKKIIIVIYFIIMLQLYGQSLPYPEKGFLYTEYTSFRYAKFLKKPVESSGYMAMAGDENFIFKQLEPVEFSIKKSGDAVTFKKGSSLPVNVNSFDNEIMILFDKEGGLSDKYEIKLSVENNFDIYQITPKDKTNKISLITIEAIGDAFQKIEFEFKNGSRLEYIFKNTKTGIKPDMILFTQ